MRPTLDQIARKHGTDKSGLSHGYTHYYEQVLEPLRDSAVNVLELGWGGHEDPDKGGASAKMWRDYFSHKRSNVIVVDNEKKNLTEAHAGVNFRLGSQADEEFLRDIHDEFGDFDLIVDDASHLSSLTIRSFEILWPMLRVGGYYVVEDTHMAYHDHYYGKHEANKDPMKPPEGSLPETAMQFLKRLADDVNFKGRNGNELDLFPREFWRGYRVEEVRFVFNLCIVKKGPDYA